MTVPRVNESGLYYSEIYFFWCTCLSEYWRVADLSPWFQDPALLFGGKTEKTDDVCRCVQMCKIYSLKRKKLWCRVLLWDFDISIPRLAYHGTRLRLWNGRNTVAWSARVPIHQLGKNVFVHSRFVFWTRNHWRYQTSKFISNIYPTFLSVLSIEVSIFRLWKYFNIIYCVYFCISLT